VQHQLDSVWPAMDAAAKPCATLGSAGQPGALVAACVRDDRGRAAELARAGSVRIGQARAVPGAGVHGAADQLLRRHLAVPLRVMIAKLLWFLRHHASRDS
jgi:hypothetical protein